MKTMIIGVMLCMLTVSGFAEDEANPFPSGVETLIASMATPKEYNSWHSVKMRLDKGPSGQPQNTPHREL